MKSPPPINRSPAAAFDVMSLRWEAGEVAHVEDGEPEARKTGGRPVNSRWMTSTKPRLPAPLVPAITSDAPARLTEALTGDDAPP